MSLSAGALRLSVLNSGARSSIDYAWRLNNGTTHHYCYSGTGQNQGGCSGQAGHLLSAQRVQNRWRRIQQRYSLLNSGKGENIINYGRGASGTVDQLRRSQLRASPEDFYLTFRRCIGNYRHWWRPRPGCGQVHRFSGSTAIHQRADFVIKRRLLQSRSQPHHCRRKAFTIRCHPLRRYHRYRRLPVRTGAALALRRWRSGCKTDCSA